MKKFLTLVTIVTLSLGMGAIALAQDAGPQGGQLQTKRTRPPLAGLKLMQRFQEDVLATLTLTDDQKKKIADLNSSTEDQIKQLIEANKGTEGNKNIGSQRRKVLVDYNNSLHDILGPDLWRQYREGMLAKMKEARERRNERELEKEGTPQQKDSMTGGGGK